jgi:hypothetical protein
VVHAAVLIIKSLQSAFGEDDQLGGVEYIPHVEATLNLGEQIGQILFDVGPVGTSVGFGLDGKSQIGFNHRKSLL